MMQQNVTDLTQEQHQAIDLLILGKSISCIAEELNIRRETLWRWRKLPAFQQLQRDLRERRREEMHELTSDIVYLALKGLRNELQYVHNSSYGGRLPAAVAALRLFKDTPLLTPMETSVTMVEEGDDASLAPSPRA